MAMEYAISARSRCYRLLPTIRCYSFSATSRVRNAIGRLMAGEGAERRGCDVGALQAPILQGAATWVSDAVGAAAAVRTAGRRT